MCIVSLPPKSWVNARQEASSSRQTHLNGRTVSSESFTASSTRMASHAQATMTELRDRTNRSSPPQRLGMYERSQQHQKKRERKLAALRQQMMNECTFTPTTRSTATSSKASSDESVFDRLYRSSTSTSSSRRRSPSVTPVKSNVTRRRDTSQSPTTSSHVSSRMEAIYEQGVRKLRSRPPNDRVEKALRDRRAEERELAHCTFRPHAHRHKLRRSMLVMEPYVVRRRKKEPPQEIIVEKAWFTPTRNKVCMEDTGISPLRNDPFLEDALSQAATEYGSI